jgi:hypothetical protein
MAHHHFDLLWRIAKDDKGDFFYTEDGNPVADHARLNRHKLQIDVLKFRAMKLLPRIYGDHKPQDTSEPAAGPLTIRWIANDAPSPEPPQPPRQIPYIKPSLPGDLGNVPADVELRGAALLALSR